MRIVLASRSPRRAQLLAAHGYAFRIIPADVQELVPPYLTPAETVLFNARAKAEAVARQWPHETVLGADTLVAADGQIFGKPATMSEALAMLRRLNGRAHNVFSGVWLVRRTTATRHGFTEISRVHFRRLRLPQLRAYLARIHPFDKAGTYAAQDDRGELIKTVEGSLTNVIGLPMETLAGMLRAFETEDQLRQTSQ